MDELEEKRIRKEIVQNIKCEIENALDKYYNKYKNNIGFLLYYPLINIEKDFVDNPDLLLIGIIEKEKVTWFLKNMLKRGLTSSEKFIFKKDEFEYYRNTLEKQIQSIYEDYNFSKEIEDEWSICKSQITKKEENKYELISSLVSGKYNNHAAYYFGYGDESEFNSNSEIMKTVDKYLYDKYASSNINESRRKINRLLIDIDSDFMKLCIDRVNSDTEKMGDKVSSDIIRYKNELNKILAFFVYISQIVNVFYKMNAKYNRWTDKFTFNEENFIKILDKDWVINKINKIFHIDKDIVDNYINYLSFDGRGTISDFPILIDNKNIIIVPSLILLNDWQFSITNGHHAKSIDFTRRDKTISHSVVSKVYDKFSEYSNISVIQEKPYTFIDKGGKKINGEIDIAAYDKLSNTMLVIECKWKDNHYVNDNENYIKIENGMKHIFNNQISRDKEFLEKDVMNIKFLFKDVNEELNINNKTKIFYIALDKRSEFHIDKQHMISLYCILGLCKVYSKDSILDLPKMIEDINTAKMKVEYYMIKEPREYKIGDVTIVNDELNLDYDNYFN